MSRKSLSILLLVVMVLQLFGSATVSAAVPSPIEEAQTEVAPETNEDEGPGNSLVSDLKWSCDGSISLSFTVRFPVDPTLILELVDENGVVQSRYEQENIPAGEEFPVEWNTGMEYIPDTWDLHVVVKSDEGEVIWEKLHNIPQTSYCGVDPDEEDLPAFGCLPNGNNSITKTLWAGRRDKIVVALIEGGNTETFNIPAGQKVTKTWDSGLSFIPAGTPINFKVYLMGKLVHDVTVKTHIDHECAAASVYKITELTGDCFGGKVSVDVATDVWLYVTGTGADGTVIDYAETVGPGMITVPLPWSNPDDGEAHEIDLKAWITAKAVTLDEETFTVTKTCGEPKPAVDRIEAEASCDVMSPSDLFINGWAYSQGVGVEGAEGVAYLPNGAEVKFVTYEGGNFSFPAEGMEQYVGEDIEIVIGEAEYALEITDEMFAECRNEEPAPALLSFTLSCDTDSSVKMHDGIVKDEDEQPMGGVPVDIFRTKPGEECEYLGSTITAQDGTYVFDESIAVEAGDEISAEIPDGQDHECCGENGEVYQDTLVTEEMLAACKVPEPKPESITQELTCKNESDLLSTGTVFDQFSNVMAGETVSIFGDDTLLGTVKTDDDGNYKFIVKDAADYIGGVVTVKAGAPGEEVSDSDTITEELFAACKLPVSSIKFDKSANVTEAHPGDEVTYTFWVQNPGDVKLNDIEINDAMFGDPIGVPDLEPGKAWLTTRTHTVKETDLGELVNTACVTSKEAQEKCDSWTVKVIEPPVYDIKQLTGDCTGFHVDGFVATDALLYITGTAADGSQLNFTPRLVGPGEFDVDEKWTNPNDGEQHTIQLTAWITVRAVEKDREKIEVTKTCGEKPKDGAITVKKVDENGEAWAGVTVELYQGDTKITEGLTPVTFSTLAYGTYTVKEIVPVGSTPLGPTEQQVTVTKDHKTVEVTFKNKRIDGAIEVTKVDQFGNTWKDVDVTVTGPDGYTANAKTPFTLNGLAYGSYTLTESVPEGSTPIDGPTLQATLTKENPSATVTFKNKRLSGDITVKKVDQDEKDWDGVVIELYEDNQKLESKPTPATFSGLLQGHIYTVAEVVPAGSEPMGPTFYTFMVDATHLHHEFTFKNKRLSGGVCVSSTATVNEEFAPADVTISATLTGVTAAVAVWNDGTETTLTFNGTEWSGARHFESAGTYSYKVKVLGEDGKWVVSDCKGEVVLDEKPCPSCEQITLTPQTADAPVIVVMNATVANATYLRVDWGDGQVQNLDPGVTTSDHLYSVPGTFTVTVYAVGADGTEATSALCVKTVTITEKPCPACESITVTPENGMAPLTVALTANVTNADHILIDWGDGTTTTTDSGMFNATHTYTTAGTYQIVTYAVAADGTKETSDACAHTVVVGKKPSPMSCTLQAWGTDDPILHASLTVTGGSGSDVAGTIEWAESLTTSVSQAINVTKTYDGPTVPYGSYHVVARVQDVDGNLAQCAADINMVPASNVRPHPGPFGTVVDRNRPDWGKASGRVVESPLIPYDSGNGPNRESLLIYVCETYGSGTAGVKTGNCVNNAEPVARVSMLEVSKGVKLDGLVPPGYCAYGQIGMEGPIFVPVCQGEFVDAPVSMEWMMGSGGASWIHNFTSLPSANQNDSFRMARKLAEMGVLVIDNALADALAAHGPVKTSDGRLVNAFSPKMDLATGHGPHLQDILRTGFTGADAPADGGLSYPANLWPSWLTE